MNELIQLLGQLEASRFFGSLELKYEAGKLVVVKKIETLKPGDICRNTRGSNEQTAR